MVSGILSLACLCAFEIILAKVAIGNRNIEEFNFQDFFELTPSEKQNRCQ